MLIVLVCFLIFKFSRTNVPISDLLTDKTVSKIIARINLHFVCAYHKMKRFFTSVIVSSEAVTSCRSQGGFSAAERPSQSWRPDVRHHGARTPVLGRAFLWAQTAVFSSPCHRKTGSLTSSSKALIPLTRALPS